MIGLIAALLGNVPGIGCFSNAEKTEIVGTARLYWLKFRQRCGRGELVSE